ncbi:MAG: DUF523 domain-containing protein [Desulfobacteraceae bacterium]|nr:DUF523 domain-containing protein [Desulfobacteraceae bacterium]
MIEFKALKIVRKFNIKFAVLKEGSPSCGSTKIYDGTFSGIKISGQGVTTSLLTNNAIKVFNEYNYKKIIDA